MDWFAPPITDEQNRGAPLVFFIHGGAWRSGEAKDYALGATDWLAQGAHWVVPDFSSVLACDGHLASMLEELKQAFALVQDMAPAMGVDLQNIHVCGHSSGAHLAACLAVATESKTSGARHPMASLMCCSGLYDLEPVRHSARSAYLALTDEAVHALSPIRHLHAFSMPIHLMCGTFELPEFMRQSHEFYQSLERSASTVRLSWAEGLNHFEVLESLALPKGPMHQVVLETLKNAALSKP
jgi:arylformamidase